MFVCMLLWRHMIHLWFTCMRRAWLGECYTVIIYGFVSVGVSAGDMGTRFCCCCLLCVYYLEQWKFYHRFNFLVELISNNWHQEVLWQLLAITFSVYSSSSTQKKKKKCTFSQEHITLWSAGCSCFNTWHVPVTRTVNLYQTANGIR